MLLFASIRPRLSDWRGWLPMATLPLFMFIALLALGGERGYFYRHGGLHSWNTSRTLAIAENLSPERNFRLAHRIFLDEDGDFQYRLYSRFPVGGYALVKLAALPFGNDLAAKLTVARVLALLMFCGAALSVCLAAARIAGSRRVAFAATLLSFSSLYALWYADALFSEATMSLFGAALTFHGMTVFVQEGRFRQLVVKTCAALLLSWHVYALLLPFIALSLGGEALALARSAAAANDKAKAARTAIISLIRSRCAALAAISFLFGASLLAFNLASEYATYGGEGQTTTRSMLNRIGVNSWATEWDTFTKRQLYRVGVIVTPYALARAAGYDFPVENNEPYEPALAPAVLGAAAAVAALAALAFVRRWRLLVATAVLFGFCWGILMRYSTYGVSHFFEGLWYMGTAMTLFALALVGARRLLGARLGGRIAIAAAALAATIFALSVFHAGPDRAGRGRSRARQTTTGGLQRHHGNRARRARSGRLASRLVVRTQALERPRKGVALLDAILAFGKLFSGGERLLIRGRRGFHRNPLSG